MSSIPDGLRPAIGDGAYHFYVSDNAKRPIVVEVFSGWVAEAGESNMRPLSQYVYGKFIKLVEVRAMDEEREVGEVSEETKSPPGEAG